ncbi:HtaA domain-containing protein [Solirubrobacter phytolaccae]|uniref:HtaA domain-containing protein n=1 Tax=Solirubrobacter phytolaccae TaxID=1404360 RepID=A0A9X3N7F0_9ACTN|nr:HtaA domain-containing protein [Solirubrobacter phytolaccae]MDA0179111.1 HtaA domain-containing protein [Solirubrobacter phytolaccae]
MKRLLGTALAFAVLAPSAQAATTGSLTLTVTAKADRALDARGVTLGTTGKVSRSGRTLSLPLSAGDAKSLRTAGGFRLRAKRRSITLTAPRLELGTNPRVTAVLGGKRSTLFTLAVAPNQTAAGVSLERTGATLGAAAARTIARKLKVRALPRSSFATVAAAASFGAPAPTAPQPAPTGPCVTTTAGGTPPTPGTTEPPVKARPAGARTVTGATLTWRVRESFIRYIAAGEGTTPSRGAAGTAPESLEGAPPLVYAFTFPFAEGWCDPATGAARIAFTGTVAFRYQQHTIDLVVNDPEVELDGPASRVIFRMTGSDGTAGGNKRAVVETLDVSKATVTGGGNAFAYERIPGAIPPGAASSLFAGYYLPGEPFGSVSISFNTE